MSVPQVTPVRRVATLDRRDRPDCRPVVARAEIYPTGTDKALA